MSRLKTIFAALLYHSTDKSFAVVQQLTFLTALLLPVLALVIFNPESVYLPGALLGLGVAAIMTVAVFSAPRQGLPLPMAWGVPTTNLVVCGICRIATYPEGAAISSLALVPALWLVVRFQVRGAVVALTALLVTVTAPSLVLESETTLASMLRYLVLPVTLCLMSVAVIGLQQSLKAAHQQTQRALVAQQEVTRNLQSRDSLLQGVLENLYVGMLVLDSQGREVITNRAQRDLHAAMSSPDAEEPGADKSQLLFHLDGTPLTPPERPEERAKGGEEFEDYVFRVGRPGPEQLILSCTAQSIEDADGNREYMVLVLRDKTTDFNILRAQQEVIVKVSHEMRTPLTAIVGFTDFAVAVLEDGPGSDSRDEAAEYLLVIQRSAGKLSSLVEDLLLQQQAMIGKMVLSLEPVDLSQLAAECAEELRPLAEERDISVTLQLEASREIEADCHRITQVLGNLIGNALKYTHIGGNVAVITRDCDDGQVAVEIVDDGPGMTQAEASKVFEPFYRASGARVSQTPGAGLGLSLAQSIVEAHGGVIKVLTSLGEGTRFTAALPSSGGTKTDLSGRAEEPA